MTLDCVARNIKMKGIPGKLQKRFVGPFEITEKIGQQAYRLSLPEDWKIHPVFHISLLKNWGAADLQEDQPIPTGDVPDVEEPYYEIERTYGGVRLKGKNNFEIIFGVMEQLSH